MRTFACLILVALSLAVGCQKSAPPPLPPPAPAADQSQLPPGHPPLNASGGMAAQALPSNAMAQTANPQWTVPAGWDLGPASSIRRGSFLVKDANGQAADIAVTVFPGDVGGLAMNVNRWRGQIGLPPAQPDEIAKLTETIDIGGTPATLVDFAGSTPPAGKTQPQRMLVVTLPHDGNSWFFKVTGDAPLVGAQKPALLAFVKSVKF